MGEPYNKDTVVDPEKGHLQADPSRPSIGEGITNMFSKAGEGITNAISKAGEGIHATGTTLKDSAKSAGAKVGLGSSTTDTNSKTPQRQKKNPDRAKHEKKFHKGFKPIPREEPKDTNIVGNITKLLPANTFLMFQTLAPLATNDGNCHLPEIIMTSVMLVILASTCMLVCFTDTIQFNGKVYHGLVTWSGLWNPSFKGDPSFVDLRQYELKLAQFYEARRRYKADKREARKEGLPVPPRPVEPPKPMGPHVMGSTYSSGNSQYELSFTDFLHAVLSAMAFGTLTMLTSPVSTCFYPNIPSTVVKTLPLLVGFVISAIFAFSPPARNGIAHPLSPKVPSQMDNYKPPDPKGVVHGPSLPPKPAGKGDDHVKPKHDDDDDDDDEGGSVKRFIGKLFSGSPDHEHGNAKSPSGASEHHRQLEGVKALASGFFSKYGDDIKQGTAKMVHSLEDDVKKEATNLMHRAAPSVVELSKEIHLPLALQEATKSVSHEALVAGLVNAGAHPALAVAAVQSAAQGAKDAALNQLHQELQLAAATSAPLAGLSKQSSMALTRANSMLQSAGSSLSLPSVHDAHDALFHQATQVLQRQASGLHAAGPDAAAIALSTGQALMQAGYQLPGNNYGQSPQAAALNTFAHGVGNLNLSAANALVKDATTLVQQGNKSFTEIHDELTRQGSAFTQGLNSQMQTFYVPGASAAQTLANAGSQLHAQVAQGTFAANVAAGVAREARTFLVEGADHGMVGVQDELSRQRATAVQSITQPVSSLAQDAAAQGSQSLSNAKAELLKQKEVLTQEMNSQARALSAPATSVAHDIAALAGSGQPMTTVSAVNSQFVESLARGMARGMSLRMRQDADAGADNLAQQYFQQLPAASVAIDVASLLQHGTEIGSQMHTQLSPQALNAAQMQAASMLQRQAAASFGQFQQQLPTAQQVADTHNAVRQFASQLSPPQSDFVTSVTTQASLIPSWRDNTTSQLVIEDLTNAAAAGQWGVERLQRGASQLPSVTEEIVAQASAMAPSTSQVRTAASRVAASASEAAGQAALASMTRILRSDRPESTEIVDAISPEEITSESETELSNRGDQFRAAAGSNSKRKL